MSRPASSDRISPTSWTRCGLVRRSRFGEGPGWLAGWCRPMSRPAPQSPRRSPMSEQDGFPNALVGMMLAEGETTAPSAAGEIIRDALDAPRPVPQTFEERWVPTGSMGRGFWERRLVGGGEWERVG